MAAVRAARSLDEAVALLDADPACRPLANGVGVLLAMARRRGGLGAQLPPTGTWIDVSRIPELAGIRGPNARGLVEIGATVTIAELGRSAVVPELLRVAAAAIGSPGIRAAATVGGNLVSRGGSSDLLVALAALGATVRLTGPDGERRRSIRWLPAQVARSRRTGEAPLGAATLLRSVLIPALRPGSGWGFERLTFQGAMDGAAVAVAVTLHGSARPGPSSGPARVVLTSIGPRRVRPRSVERLLETDPDASASVVMAAVTVDLERRRLHDDHRVSAWYRRAVAPVLIVRAVSAAQGRRS